LTATCSISRRTIAGWEAVALENGRLRVAVLPAKGADVVELVDLESGIDLLFKAPWGLLPPGSPPREGSGDIEFVWNYEGGWQELFPNVNDASSFDGVAVPFHGEAALLPWEAEVVRDDGDEVALRLSVRLRLLPFRLERVLRLRAGARELEVEGTVSNEGPARLPFVWGHHCVVGPPFLEAGCRIDVARATIVTLERIWEDTARLEPGRRSAWPDAPLRSGGTVDLSQVPGPEAGSHDDVYLGDLADGSIAVTNPRLALTFRLRWDPSVFRWIILWQPYGGAVAPDLAGSYALGVEPWTSRLPLADSVESGDARWLEPGERFSTSLVASIHRA
jgi:galactose mutarotase-like enzyme